MESQSRVRRHEITKNGIDVKIRDPYRYRSDPVIFRPLHCRERERDHFFFLIKYKKRKKSQDVFFAKLLLRESINEVKIYYRYETFLPSRASSFSYINVR